MINLLEETEEIMKDYGQSPETVSWVTSLSKGEECIATWDEFKILADFTYDAGFGGAEINEDLKVIFKDGSWLERHEYDGSEWWEYKKTPKMTERPRAMTRKDI